jgi:hypothetical protein
MCVCVCEREASAHKRARTHTNAGTHAHAHAHARARTRAHAHAHACTHAHTHTHTYRYVPRGFGYQFTTGAMLTFFVHTHIPIHENHQIGSCSEKSGLSVVAFPRRNLCGAKGMQACTRRIFFNGFGPCHCTHKCSIKPLVLSDVPGCRGKTTDKNHEIRCHWPC